MAATTARFAQLAGRIFNAPLAVRPDKAEVAVAAVAERLGLTRIVRADGASLAPSAAAKAAIEADPWLAEPNGTPDRRGYDVIAGVAVIEVHGMLVQRLYSLRPWSGMTGYDGLRQNLLTALSDPQVRAIVLDLDSPGGEVAGCFDLADTLFALRGRGKPIWGICAEAAYSAAYAIASACDRVTVPRTGGAGSIGVITMLADFSRALDEEGVTVHFVTYGDRKAEEGRSRYTGVTPELLARVQAEIDRVGELFVATVARNRGLSPGAIRGQQAACFMGAVAVEQGLADVVMAPDEAFRDLLSRL
jgi:ClpP class serine protease